MRKILESCPTCGGAMAVSELSCTVCDTVVRSRYTPCPFCRLSPEDLAFMLLFVRSRGNVKDMERELGVSYWTIRGRLNELIATMGLGGDDETPSTTADRAGDDAPSGKEAAREASGGETVTAAAGRASGKGPTATERQSILDRLKRGELTPTQAAALLSGN